MGNIRFDVDAFRECFKKSGRKYAEVDRMLGFTANHISACMNSGSMNEEHMERICMFLGITVDDVRAKEPKPKKKEPKIEDPHTDSMAQAFIYAQNKNSERIISYIQDVGKILTDVMRENRELRATLTEVKNQMAVQSNTTAKLLSAMADRDDRFYVSSNSIMNKILNQMKYGERG